MRENKSKKVIKEKKKNANNAETKMQCIRVTEGKKIKKKKKSGSIEKC